MRSRKYSVSILLLAVAVAAGFWGFRIADDVQFARAAQEVNATRDQLAHVEDLADVFRDVGTVIEPSVVNIEVKKTVPGAMQQLRPFLPNGPDDGFPGFPPGFGGGDQAEVGTGSGVIMEVDGNTAYIVTNNHVAGGAQEMEITLSDGRTISDAKLVGTDAKSDIAVVRIQADHLIAAKWGDSGTLHKGDWVLAFGSPLGYVGSMTHGIVSALNRHDVGILARQQGYEDFIQVDAPINPGNSGGPLVNVHGEVIGINTAIASQTGGWQGIGFAVPSNQAKFVYQQLKENGRVVRGFIGISIDNVSNHKDEAKALGYDSDQGIIVERTEKNSPADGKFQPSDIIIKSNDKAVGATADFREQVAANKPGTEMNFTVFRDGKQQDVTIKLGEQPQDMLAASGGGSRRGNRGENNATALGMRLATLTPDLAKQFDLDPSTKGVVVTEVQNGSLAEAAGLAPGDVITRVGNDTVTTAQEAGAAIAKHNVKQGIRFYVTNKDESRFVFIQSAQ
jgi:serine protease Do